MIRQEKSRGFSIVSVSEDAFFTEGFEGNFVEGNGGVLGAAKGRAHRTKFGLGERG